MARERPAGIALITGASGGIGAELARIFAGHGYDLVLVARTQARLEELGRQLAQQHGVRYTVVTADLAQPEAPASIVAALKEGDLQVEVLVNNAGFGGYGPFAILGLEQQLEMLQVNVVALTHLTRLLLPDMVARGRGRILNVASVAAFFPGPLMAVYFASKAYVLSLTEALAVELKGTGVRVTALCPGATRTEFQARAAMEESKLVQGRGMMEASAVAREGFAALMRGQTVVIPGVLNRLMTLAPRLLPRGLVAEVVRRVQDRAHA